MKGQFNASELKNMIIDSFVIELFLCAFQACAPRYYWRTEHDTPFADVTGTCYLSDDGLKTFVEYAPCRTGELLQ